MLYRSLSRSEILQLQAQHCTAEDWSRVHVGEPFHPERVLAVAFSGAVRLGTFSSVVPLPGGIVQPTGVFRSRVHECAIGDDCLVSDVGSLANYEVAAGARIENVGALRVTGETSFGNGVEIDVMNEAGGRTLPLCDRLSAQLAYLIVFYRHQPELVARLSALVQAYAAGRRGRTGHIGEHAQIANVGTITNVDVGAFARVDGASRLEEGTIRSCEEAPVYVGADVIAKHFIILSGARVDQGAIVDRCLVGQSVKVGKQYSAENSVFFCNSELFHGEACSVFAGPYTVSHHKSTLLIAGFFSFYNAGSGTNQSNHMYKLGPVHQGIVERGSKTGSFSYLLWPSRVGAFSSVIGKHFSHFDAADLPFSVISESDGRTVCIPGMNMFTVGTRRDSVKWPARDGRKDPVRLDRIHFALWSPWLIGRILRGLEKLNQLATSAREGQELLNFNGIAVQKMLVRTSARYYEMALRLFVGDGLLRQLESMAPAASLEEVQGALSADVASELDRWLDVNGMFVREPALEALLARVSAGEMSDLDALEGALDELFRSYDRDAWSWCAKLIENRTGVPLARMGAAELAAIVEQWRETTLKFNNMILQDARKEFDADMRLGYGIDGDVQVRDADFAAVRGTHEQSSFVRSLLEDSENAAARAQRVLDWLVTRERAAVPPLAPSGG